MILKITICRLIAHKYFFILMQECLVLEKYVTVAHFGVLDVILSNDFFINL